MSWPRKNEIARIYRETRNPAGPYLVVIIGNGLSMTGEYDAIANVWKGSDPSLCGTSVPARYLLGKKRVEFAELPARWQNAIRNYWEVDGDSVASTIGFHRVRKPDRERSTLATHGLYREKASDS